HPHAVQQWRARAQLDPLSAPPTLALMQSLVAAGDRASAIAAGDAYAALVRRELASAPDPTIAGLVTELRAQPAGRIVSPTGSASSREGGESTLGGAAGADGEPRTLTAPSPDPATAKARRRLRNARVTAAISWTALAILLALRWMDRPTTPRSPERIAVFPFTVSGPVESQYLGNGLVDLLSTSLDGAGAIRSVDPNALLHSLERTRPAAPTPLEAAALARRLGAGRYVLGSVTASGPRLRLLASLYRQDRPDSAIGSAVVEGDATELFAMVDQLTSQLLAASLPEPRHRLTRVAALTTPSLAALKHYLAGEEELRAGNYIEAADAFQRAVRTDSGFALAYYRLSLAADWLGRDSLARSAAEAALARAERLSGRDSLLVAAALTARRGELTAAERLYRRIVIDYPDDIEAWAQLGDLLFHANPLRGRSVVEARDAFAHVLALDPDDADALLHLARIAYLQREQGEVDTLVRQLVAGATSDEVLELRSFRAFALSDRDSWKRVTRELLANPPEVPPVTALEVALYLDDVDGTEQFATTLAADRYSNDIRGLGHRLLARVFATRGMWDSARTQLDGAERFDAVATLELRSLLASLDFLEVPVEELRVIRAEVERWDVSAADRTAEEHSASHVGMHAGVRAYRLGLLSTRLGDLDAASAQADSLDRHPSSDQGRAALASRAMSRSLRARVAHARGDAAEALRQLEQANWLPIESGFEEEAGDRYLRAVVLAALDRKAEAHEWFRTIAERGMHELVYIAPSRLREAVLACELGDRDAGARALATAARLWAKASPPLIEAVRRTESRLRELGVTVAGNAVPR
ncbi:MAG TPA: hypothetical protein VFZ73_11055, partial [Gemmatimonadaceae bacterium]